MASLDLNKNTLKCYQDHSLKTTSSSFQSGGGKWYIFNFHHQNDRDRWKKSFCPHWEVILPIMKTPSSKAWLKNCYCLTYTLLWKESNPGVFGMNEEAENNGKAGYWHSKISNQPKFSHGKQPLPFHGPPALHGAREEAQASSRAQPLLT